MGKWYAGYEEYPNFMFFDEILQIPRGSFHEERIADYLEDFAKKRNLYCHRDDIGNIIIKKPGSGGKEQDAPLMLQSHIDMVCMKLPGVNHDFEKDPIPVVVEDGWLKTKGTTLGADDGAGVALMLAMLDDSSLVHPPLECVFTVQEEDGMGGAKGLDFAQLSAKRMIGLDGLKEGATIFSASSVKAAKIIKSFQSEDVEDAAYGIKVSGLTSGHGANNIGFGQANAIKAVGDILYKLKEQFDIRLCAVNGGTMVHTIPPECEGIFRTAADSKAVIALAEEIGAKLKEEYQITDPNMEVTIAAATLDIKAMPKDVSNDVINMLYILPIGPTRRRLDQPERVVGSLNVTIAKTVSERIEFDYVTRANKPLDIEALYDKAREMVKAYGADFELTMEYDGHDVNEQSPLTTIWRDVYKERTGNDLTMMYLHSGLDAGTIYTALDMNDLIVVVPDVADVHTPQERMNLESFARSYGHLKEIIARA